MKPTRFSIDTFIENPKLIILACSKDCVLAYHKETLKMHYIYKPSKDMAFNFSLLCEVGQYYQKWFESAIEELKLTIIDKKTDNDFFEVIVL